MCAVVLLDSHGCHERSPRPANPADRQSAETGAQCVGSVVHAIEIKRVPGKPERRARENTELKGGFVPRNSLNSWLYLARPLPISYNLHAFADRTDDGVILVSPLLTGGWKDGTQVAE
jgi:hypothetical protein